MKQKTNKVAVVFGGSNGIGLATAKKLASNGVDVVIVGQNEGRLRAAKEILSIYKVKAITYSVDISDVTSIKNMVEDIEKEFGGVDYLVNASGKSIAQKQGVFDPEAFNQLLSVNLAGVYHTCMLFGYELMNKNGAIVNISSVRGRTGTDSFSQGYAASKAGVINLTKTFAIELASRSIRVNCVAPGAVYPTGISQTWSDSLREIIANSIPMKRLGTPDEIADVVHFLLSDKSSFITGQTIDVNGGQWMN